MSVRTRSPLQARQARTQRDQGLGGVRGWGYGSLPLSPCLRAGIAGPASLKMSGADNLAACAAYNLAAPFRIMKFTLNYRGDLRASSSGGSSRLNDKWHIRRQIHPQLKELWQNHHVLKRIHMETIVPEDGESFLQTYTHHSANEKPGDWSGDTVNLIDPIDVAEKSFIPLVRESMSLVCDLDILFLRKGEPGQLVSQGGDIDNRIKTLLDGLRMPENATEIGNRLVYRPMYCLLENDSLITGLNVRTDQLLDPRMKSIHAAHLIIGVTINVVHVRPYNLRLLGL